MADAEKKKRLNVEFKSMPESLEEQFLKDFPSYDVEGLVRGEPGGFVLTPQYGEHAEELYNFHVRPDDIWVLSFPKSGESITRNCLINRLYLAGYPFINAFNVVSTCKLWRIIYLTFNEFPFLLLFLLTQERLGLKSSSG